MINIERKRRIPFMPALPALLLALLLGCSSPPKAVTGEATTSTGLVVEEIEGNPRECITRSWADFRVTVRNKGVKESHAMVKFYIDGHCVDAQPLALQPICSEKVHIRVSFRDADKGARVARAVAIDEKGGESALELQFTVRDPLRVLLIDGEPKAGLESETWLLQLALHPVSLHEAPDPTERRLYIDRPDVVERLIPVKDLKEKGYSNYDIVMMANVDLGENCAADAEIEALEAYVRGGGKLIIWLGDKVDGRTYNRRLFKAGEGILPAELAPRPTGTKFSDAGETDLFRFDAADLNHPIMRIFARSKVLESEEESPSISRCFMMRAAEGSEVAARFDLVNTMSKNPEKLPAVVLKRFRSGGAVILVNTTPDAEWNNLNVSPKDAIYLVLVHQMVHHLMGMDNYIARAEGSE